MNANVLSCELVDLGELDLRYLASTLPEPEAEAFEVHFFACDRCWGLVQHGLEAQAAHLPARVPAPTATAPAPLRWPGRHRGWWGLAAAAALALTVVGVRWLQPVPERSDTLRGGGAAVVVSPGATEASFTAAWARVSEADIYRARLFTADGILLAEREVADTFVSVAADSLPAFQLERGAFWQVQALGPLRRPIARSGLIKAVQPASRR